MVAGGHVAFSSSASEAPISDKALMPCTGGLMDAQIDEIGDGVVRPAQQQVLE